MLYVLTSYFICASNCVLLYLNYLELLYSEAELMNCSHELYNLYGMILQDFRLQDPSEYEEWYGQAHRAVDLQV